MHARLGWCWVYNSHLCCTYVVFCLKGSFNLEPRLSIVDLDSDSMALVYEYVKVPKGSTYESVKALSMNQWRPLPPRQCERFEKDEYQVIFVQLGFSLVPWKVALRGQPEPEINDRLQFWKFCRTGHCELDLWVRMMWAGTVATQASFHVLDDKILVYLNLLTSGKTVFIGKWDHHERIMAHHILNKAKGKVMQENGFSLMSKLEVPKLMTH